MSFTAILYTHEDLSELPYAYCFRRIQIAIGDTSSHDYLPPHCIAVTSTPQKLPRPWVNVVATGERGLHDCYTKIIAALEIAKHPQVFLLEHDVLYPDGYFDYVLDGETTFCYNLNVWTLNETGAWHTPRWLTSNLAADRALLRRQFAARLDLLNRGERVQWDEPGRNPGDIAEAAESSTSRRHGPPRHLRNSHAGHKSCSAQPQGNGYEPNRCHQRTDPPTRLPLVSRNRRAQSNRQLRPYRVPRPNGSRPGTARHLSIRPRYRQHNQHGLLAHDITAIRSDLRGRRSPVRGRCPGPECVAGPMSRARRGA